MLRLVPCGKYDPLLTAYMRSHYSAPKGFVGRSIAHLVFYGETCYGGIVGGSATKHLPGRNEFLGSDLNRIVNNVFFHLEPDPIHGYPARNFVSLVLATWESWIPLEWEDKYGISITGLETLVELPRLGSCYLREKWVEVGITKGHTCKRVSEKEAAHLLATRPGTTGGNREKWGSGGVRVWDRLNLRPKRVLCKKITER